MIQPTFDNLIISSPITEQQSSIIAMPENNNSPHERSLVIAVGKGRYNKQGILEEPEVKVGDTVIYPRGIYKKLHHDGEDVYILHHNHVIAVIEND